MYKVGDKIKIRDIQFGNCCVNTSLNNMRPKRVLTISRIEGYLVWMKEVRWWFSKDMIEGLYEFELVNRFELMDL